jgi:hypothetical protein
VAEALWNARNLEHLSFFRREVLAPLIVATRPMDLRTPDAVDDAARAWILSLKDVPRQVLVSGVEALLIEGPTWMPKPGDLRRVCAASIAARRKAISARATAMTAECEDCQGSTWAPFTDTDGVPRVSRCGCHRRALTLYEGLPEPLALPPAEREDGAA